MEEWKDIPGYEGLYEASNTGLIRTKLGKTTSSARFKKRVWKQRIMKFKYQSRGDGLSKDARVELWKDGSHKTMLVARLVALTWVDGYQKGLTVNHIDGNPLNNHASNLEWISRGDNIRHGFQTGLYSSNEKPCRLTDKFGNSFSFKSQADANRFLHRSYSYLSNVILHNRLPRATDGTEYILS